MCRYNDDRLCCVLVSHRIELLALRCYYSSRGESKWIRQAATFQQHNDKSFLSAISVLVPTYHRRLPGMKMSVLFLSSPPASRNYLLQCAAIK